MKPQKQTSSSQPLPPFLNKNKYKKTCDLMVLKLKDFCYKLAMYWCKIIYKMLRGEKSTHRQKPNPSHTIGSAASGGKAMSCVLNLSAAAASSPVFNKSTISIVVAHNCCSLPSFLTDAWQRIMCQLIEWVQFRVSLPPDLSCTWCFGTLHFILVFSEQIKAVKGAILGCSYWNVRLFIHHVASVPHWWISTIECWIRNKPRPMMQLRL